VNGMKRKKIGYGRMQSKLVGGFIMQVVLLRRGGKLVLLVLVVILQVGVGHLNRVNHWVVFLANGRELVTILRFLKFRD
jgi:hypothetical protein